LLLAVACVCAAIGLIAPAAASAAPNITLEKHAPETALLGTSQKVQLVAKNPKGQIRGYNLTFRDVLPAGVEYVGGSSTKVAPRLVPNAPGVGMTTLIFENVADLSGNSEYDLEYEVKPSTSFFKINKEEEEPAYTNKAEAFVNEKAREKPRFTALGEPVPNTFTGKALAEATTELTAIEIEKSNPRPEGEILRGVHDHQTTYTLRVRNNKFGPSKVLEVEDLLPAGLEFLGCGEVDNTTDTKTNPGSNEEYPGSGKINPGNAPTGAEEAKECSQHEPYWMATVLNPPGHPAGVYTQVKWKNLPELPAGGEFKIQYVAAIPILRNAMTWQDGIEPTAESLLQVANLDNNTGAETSDEEALTNFAEVHGEYEEVKVKDGDEMTRTAEDLAIQKGMDPPQTIFEGAETNWTLNLEASEYRRTEPVTITDHLPNGLCPRGPLNYEGPEGPIGGTITEPKPECAASGTLHPSVKYLNGSGTKAAGAEEPIEYSFVEEEEGGPEPRTEGGFNLEFKAPDVTALERLEPSQELLITFPTTTRTYYQNEFKDNLAKPVLTGDSWTNNVSTEGQAFSRCIVKPATPDPNCEAPGAETIVEEEPAGTHVTDLSSASQEAGGVEIEKTVRENNGPVPTLCKNAPEGEYVKGIVSPKELTLPQYRPGDEICWRLVVKFASNLYAGTPVVSDFIPPDEEYVQGSQEEGIDNTVTEVKFNEEEETKKEEALEWTLGKGGSVEKDLRFEYLFKTKVKSSAETDPGEITGNLMKFLFSNTAGQTFPLRDRAEVQRQEPDLSLEKFITEVAGKEIPKAPQGEKSTAVAGGGKIVKYELDLENAGNLDAEEAEVWDELPAGIECSDVIEPMLTPPQTVGCSGGIIKWTGVSILEGALTTLTYEVEVPKDVAPGHVFVNHAGVTRYKSQTNTTPGKYEYLPAKNIDKAITEEESNTGSLLDEAELKTTGATLEKAAATETTQPGNLGKEATIGELIDYTVTAKIPANSKLFGAPVIKDVLPGTLKLEGPVIATLDGTTLPTEGVTLNTLANGAEVLFGGAYPAVPGPTEHVVVMTFKARVLNTAANVRGTTIKNEAGFEFKDGEAGETKKVAKSVGTPVVEPEIEVRKKDLLPAGQTTVAPGEIVKYETEVENKLGASTANEVEVVDTVPVGMKVVGTPSPAATVAGNTITWHIGAIAPNTVESLLYELEIERPAKAASSFTNRVIAMTQSLPEGEAGEPSQIRTAEFGQEGYDSEDQNTVKLVGATVHKEVTPTEGTIGKELTYTLNMNLPPEIEYFNTTMVDRLPNGVTFDEITGSACEVEGGAPCSPGEEVAIETQPDGTTLIGWYFGLFEPDKARELTLTFKAHIDDVKVGGGAKVKAPETLTNQLVGVYNETKGIEKPTTVPVPGANTFSEETEPAEATTTVVEPNVTLAKTVAAEPPLVGEIAAQPGSKLTYSLTVGNNGTSTAYEVEVKDKNPTGNLRNITPVAGAEFIKSTAGEPPVWVLPKVEVGEPVTLTYTAELAPSGQLKEDEEVKNAAEVPSYFGLEKTEREAAKASRKYKGPKAAKNLEVALPKIGVVKTTGEAGFPDEATAEVGKAFPWRVVVKNESAVAEAKAVNVEDLLPPNWTYVSGSTEFKAVGTAEVVVAFDPAGAATSVLSWANIAKLPPTASVEVLFEAIPSVAAITHLPQQENKAVGTFQDHSGAIESEAGLYRAEDKAFAHLLWPELGIHKTPDGGETVAGSNDKYVITVENGGTGTAHEVEVKDVLSKGQEFVGPATANPPAGFAQKSVEPNTPGTGETTVIWAIAEVVNGTPVTIEVPIETEPSLNEGAVVTDLATASSPQQVEKPSDPGSFVVHREADLMIEKKADRENIVGGETLTYTLTAKNLGPSDASGVTVTDKIPAGTTFIGATEPGCTFAAEEVTCLDAGLKAGEEVEFQVEVEVESKRLTPIVNTAKVKGNEKDPNPTNDEKTIETEIGGTANLAIEKIGPEKPVLLGNDFTYEIKVENIGPSDAVNATVEDQLPPQVKFFSATTSVGTCDEAPGALLTCDLERMLPHATATIIVSVEAVGVGSFVNKATFDSDTSPEPKEGEAPAEIVPAADLTITKTAPATVGPDGSLTYTLQVENHGPSIAHQVKVTDPLPADVDLVSASEGCAVAGTTVTCEVLGGELAVGDAADFQVTVHVPFALGGGSLTNTATVAGEEGDPHPEDNSSTVATTVGPVADLAITKTMAKAQAGQPLTYTLAVTNKGPSASSAVTVKDTLPGGTTFKSATPSQGTCTASGQTVTCALGQLASGGSAQVSITVDVAATATSNIRNSATVEGPEPDPDKSNNEASVEGPVTPPVPTDPNLKVVKTADTSTPAVGAPFAYHVEVTNVSGGEAKNVKVVDTLNGPVKVTSIETEAGKCGASGSTITCNIPSIPVGKTVHITYTVVAEAAGELKNTVSAQAANGEKAPANNRAVKSVKAKAAKAKYTLTKTASRKVVPGGKKLGFTITLQNGFAAMTNAKVCDRLPAALVFVKAPGARYVNGEACWMKKYVAANEAVKLHLIARAVKGYKSLQVRNVATSRADNAGRRSASVAVRIKAAFAGKPGGVTG
jgi:uncharacterized repeat protein (TIGR01451 family)/fimbrial isopeptide formation D2 family protein